MVRSLEIELEQVLEPSRNRQKFVSDKVNETNRMQKIPINSYAWNDTFY